MLINTGLIENNFYSLIPLLFKDPCEDGKACGECAGCRVANHVAQCSCPANYYGNALISCSKSMIPCDGACECDEVGFCTKSCHGQDQCSCGEVCHSGKCRVKCDVNNYCPKVVPLFPSFQELRETERSCCNNFFTLRTQGYVCDEGLCLVGCRTHSDCPSSLSCVNGQCEDPCSANGSPCGINALCRVSNHRAVCLCPEGFQGEPSQECYQLECHRDEDCEANKRCSEDGVCTNPCLQHGVCGFNAQCRVVSRKAQCSCPPGHYGNPQINCKKGNRNQTRISHLNFPDNLKRFEGGDECLRRPCGVNAKCRETLNGFECTCDPGCHGDPHQACICDGGEPCKDMRCGVNAACRIYKNQPQCYCPSNYPSGDPMHACEYHA